MNNYPKPSAPPLEPELQFQYITYPQQISNPNYINSLPQHVQPYYRNTYENRSTYYNHGEIGSEKNTSCFTYIATAIACICCCFIVDDETRV